MNLVILHGRLAKDVDLRYTQSGKPVAAFTVAVDRPKTANSNGPTADFIGCVAWEKTAETIGNYMKKGSEIVVTGKLQTRSYDANDGTKRYVTEIIVDRFEFCGSKADNAANSNTGNSGFNNNFNNANLGGGMNIKPQNSAVDDIPF